MKTLMKFIRTAFAVAILAIGALTANGAPGDLFASIDRTIGDRVGQIYKYTPSGAQSIFSGGIVLPRGVAFDYAGNLFVAISPFTNPPFTFHPGIVKINASGGQRTFATLGDNDVLEGLAVDRLGNVFAIISSGIIYKFNPSGSQSMFGSVPGNGWSLAIDSAGNLFAACGSCQAIYKFTPNGTASLFASTAGFPDAFPVGLAFDGSGNLFVSAGPFAQGQDLILEFAPNGTGSIFATGLYGPRGVAVDASGNLFVAELGAGDILKFTPNGTRSVFASGFLPDFVPEFLAIQPPRRPPPRPRP
jgi:sugar lactone lactonase YvrE